MSYIFGRRHFTEVYNARKAGEKSNSAMITIAAKCVRDKAKHEN